MQALWPCCTIFQKVSSLKYQPVTLLLLHMKECGWHDAQQPDSKWRGGGCWLRSRTIIFTRQVHTKIIIARNKGTLFFLLTIRDSSCSYISACMPPTYLHCGWSIESLNAAETLTSTTSSESVWDRLNSIKIAKRAIWLICSLHWYDVALVIRGLIKIFNTRGLQY